MGAPPVAGGVSKRTPAARMSWAKTVPNSSSRTLPMYAVRLPSDAAPTTELATDPPETSMPGPMWE